MKSSFSWYFPVLDDERKKIWDTGVLTVDANVLLDLYRYHENTRNSLLTCIESFKGRLWISRQAAQEFFRNRSKVIISSSKGFNQASDELSKLRKAVSAAKEQLQGNRLISNEITDKLNASISDALDKAGASITEAGTKHPNYLLSDPILDTLLTLFEGAVGDTFSEDQLKTLRSEADARRKNKVPPGYLDEDKDADRPFGDFFLWRQLLDHAKKLAQPMIFVTSERKEDWWERVSGQTVGPRLELIQEAYEYSGQRVLIYQTDHFLKFALERTGKQVDVSAVEEIRAVDSLRADVQNAVKVISQNVISNGPSLNKGTLAVELQRPLFKFTASGHFDPLMLDAPRLTVKLIENPDDLPRYRLGAGTGTVHDFNVHLKSEEYGVTLPAGRYTFEYIADLFPTAAPGEAGAHK
ncbi:MAG: PIN domain-containing protein [Sulfobacillus sp.]